jgi:hypothetical protein
MREKKWAQMDHWQGEDKELVRPPTIISCKKQYDVVKDLVAKNYKLLLSKVRRR